MAPRPHHGNNAVIGSFVLTNPVSEISVPNDRPLTVQEAAENLAFAFFPPFFSFLIFSAW